MPALPRPSLSLIPAPTLTFDTGIGRSAPKVESTGSVQLVVVLSPSVARRLYHALTSPPLLSQTSRASTNMTQPLKNIIAMLFKIHCIISTTPPHFNILMIKLSPATQLANKTCFHLKSVGYICLFPIECASIWPCPRRTNRLFIS